MIVKAAVSNEFSSEEAGLIVAGLLGTAMIALTIEPTLGKQFGILAEASTLFALLTYLGACAAAVKYRVAGERTLAIVGGVFCVFVIAWSTVPVLIATLTCMGIFVLLYLPLRRQKYLLPDPTVRAEESAKLQERHDNGGPG